MNDIGIKIFSGVSTDSIINIKGIDKIPGKSISRGFLSIYTFTYDTSLSPYDIDTAIFNKEGSSSLVFSPMGHIYIIQKQQNTSNTLSENVLNYFENPLQPFRTDYIDHYASNYLKWSVVDYSQYSKYNNEAQYPQFFASLDGDLGYGAIGAGYLLYRNTPYTGSTSSDCVYYLLYNPFDRVSSDNTFIINKSPLLFGNYCSAIQYQDSGCYCVNTPNNHRCLYAAANSQSAGDTLLEISHGTDPTAISAYNAFIANCGCNQVCKNWGGITNLSADNKASCAQSTTNVFCTVGLSASQKSKIETSGVNTTQNCSANNNIQQPQIKPHEDGNGVTTKQLIIAVSVLVSVIIIAVVFIKV